MITTNKALLFALFSTCLQAGTPEQELKDIEQQSTRLVVEETEHMCTLCNEIAQIYIELGGDSQNEDVQALLAMKKNPVTYDTLLNVVYACLTLEWPEEQAAQETKEQLSILHEEMTEEYDSMLAQLAVRKRLKSKCFCTLSAANLVACRARIKGNVTIDGSATIANNLRVDNTLTVDDLNGVVMATDGLISTGLVQNADLADNSITSNKIVDGAVLPSKLSFNTVDTSASEPNPLRIYRGAVASNGTITDGNGFTVIYDGGSPGQYLINLGQAYASGTSYQVFVEPHIANIANKIFPTILKNGASSFLVQTYDDMNINVNNAFDFFTIGSRP